MKRYHNDHMFYYDEWQSAPYRNQWRELIWKTSHALGDPNVCYGPGYSTWYTSVFSSRKVQL